MPQSCGNLIGRGLLARRNIRAKAVGVGVFGMLLVASVFSGAGSAHAEPSLDGSGFVAVAPARILDTRADSTTVDDRFARGGAIGATSTLDLKVTGRAGVPVAGVGAVVLNVTAVDQSSPTYLTVFPTGASRPLASNLNPAPGVTQATLVVAKVGADGEVSIYNNAGTVNVIADVQGWFPISQGSAYTPVVPARILETRAAMSSVDGLDEGSGALGAGRTLELTVVGRGGVPGSGVGAVALSITATNQSRPTFITAFPTGSSRPNASSLNPSPSMVASNLAIVKVGTGGTISIYNDSGSVDLIVDVQGWFPTGPAYTAVEPARVFDSRPGLSTVDGVAAGGGALSADSIVNLDIAGRGGVPPTGVS
ncbi:MAG TPA: hypothetical protein VHQ23_18620, partial [Ilumatobacteraceae bacterium]|nr:hypothetical protein [Ilumatobacteraceae bacterium]